LLFALMFKFVPARSISWKNVGIGAIGSALLFTIGKLLLGLYLGKASVGSGYGIAGSLVAVIVWVYYSAQIFFFGAEFTRVYADAHATAEDRKSVDIGARATVPAHTAVRGKSRSSLLIAATIAFLFGRKSAKAKSSD